MERRKLVAGNWKMNGLRADGVALARAVAAGASGGGPRGPEILVCPPFTLLAAAGEALAGTGVALGAQDCHPAAKGAHTGDVSAAMLRDAGCAYAIVGHSERRRDHGEGDALVRAKAEAAVAAGMAAVVCVGETEEERDAGRAEAVVGAQIEGSLPAGASAASVVVAYEPVWAIGTGRTPTPEDIAAMHAHVRRTLAGRLADADGVRILYGGSVKASNAAAILALPDVDGALVGGASLDAGEFLAIARAAG